MRILANKNLPLDVVVSLRDAGHDVWWVRTEAPGISDREVIDRARRESRLIITFDKDFGELAFRTPLPTTTGIILFRLRFSSSIKFTHFIGTVLQSRDDWFGHFAVVDNFRIRLRSLTALTNED